VPDERTERIALNESRFRQINDQLRADLAKLPQPPEVIPFVCECGHADCTAVLELTVPEYESIRANSRRFVVMAGHEIADAETVVAYTSGYAVVEKLPDSAPLTDATDPRRGEH
jgi:hypothetical protein